MSIGATSWWWSERTAGSRPGCWGSDTGIPSSHPRPSTMSRPDPLSLRAVPAGHERRGPERQGAHGDGLEDRVPLEDPGVPARGVGPAAVAAADRPRPGGRLEEGVPLLARQLGDL